MTYTLTFSEPGRTPQSHAVPDRGLLVGRDSTCDVVLQSKDVSRRHAKFFLRAGALHVEDLGSQNGVFWKGARLNDASEVPAGATLELGDVRVAVVESTQALSGLGAGAVLRAGSRDFKLPAKATVGRGGDCDVVLDDDSVSRKHAELARDDRGIYRVKDLGSANGTQLDGKPVGKDPVLVPAGARLRFGEVELLFFRSDSARPPMQRRMILLGALVVATILTTALILVKPQKAETPREQTPQEKSAQLLDQAQAALESERFDESARLASEAAQLDPISPAARKLLSQARLEQDALRSYNAAMGRAQVGREDEALAQLAQVPPQSRIFARARIKAKELAETILRTRGAACRSAPREDAAEIVEQCGKALDVKCQTASVEEDSQLKALRAAEKKLGRKVAWSCPQQLAPLFHDEGATTAQLDEKALAALYPDPQIRSGIGFYIRGDVASAIRTLSRKPGAADFATRIKAVDGRFREGQTALLGGAVDRADSLWAEALAADAALLPAGVESFYGRQMRNQISQAHAKAGDDKLAKAQYASAYDEWQKGLAFAPRDPHLLDQLSRLEKVAENLEKNSPSCEQLQTALHITRADPSSAAHEEAQKQLASCK